MNPWIYFLIAYAVSVGVWTIVFHRHWLALFDYDIPDATPEETEYLTARLWPVCFGFAFVWPAMLDLYFGDRRKMRDGQ